jgi:hypothetical protein
MLIIKKQRFGISYDYVWFAQRPSTKNIIRRVVYMQCLESGPAPGYLRRTFYTKIIDLGQDPEVILSATSRSTSYQIKRAIREGVTLAPVTDVADFVSFYNEFSRTKQRGRLTGSDLLGWGQDIVAFAAMSERQPAVMHTYVVDSDLRRARLLHSASHFRTTNDTSQRNAVGRANRFLHYATILHFRDRGFTQYDMGGYAKGSSDPTLQAIARFKDGFGGELVREDRYVSIPMHILQLLGLAAHRVRKPFPAK